MYKLRRCRPELGFLSTSFRVRRWLEQPRLAWATKCICLCGVGGCACAWRPGVSAGLCLSRVPALGGARQRCVGGWLGAAGFLCGCWKRPKGTFWFCVRSRFRVCPHSSLWLFPPRDLETFRHHYEDAAASSRGARVSLTVLPGTSPVKLGPVLRVRPCTAPRRTSGICLFPGGEG